MKETIEKEKYDRAISALVRAKGQLREAGIESPEDVEMQKVISKIRGKIKLSDLAKKLYAPGQLENHGHQDIWSLDHCPFCNDHEEELILDDGLGIYQCYRCKAKGTIFNLYMKAHRHLSFGETLKNLADWAGVELPPVRSHDCVTTEREHVAMQPDKEELFTNQYHLNSRWNEFKAFMENVISSEIEDCADCEERFPSISEECDRHDTKCLPDDFKSTLRFYEIFKDQNHVHHTGEKVEPEFSNEDRLYVEFMREAIALNGKLPCPRPPTSDICKYCDTNKDPVEACVEVFLTFNQWKEGQ